MEEEQEVLRRFEEVLHAGETAVNRRKQNRMRRTNAVNTRICFCQFWSVEIRFKAQIRD